MKGLIALAVSVLLLFPLPVTAGNNYWTTRSGDRCESADKQLKYKEYGHLNTTDLVADFAGVQDPEVRKRLAFFSQAPDRYALIYSAPAVAVWAFFLPWEWDYRWQNMNYLHSLHGGDHQAVMERRARLRSALEELDLGDRNNHWKAGFLIHAMGDSYAHTRGPLDNLSAYAPDKGHAMALINQPDTITANNNYLIYLDYVEALYRALDRGRGNPAAMEAYREHLRARVESGISEQELKCLITGYLPWEKGVTVRVGAGELISEAQAKAWREEIRRPDVVRLLVGLFEQE